jgi:hypothetical protein
MNSKYTTGRKGAFEDQGFWRTTPCEYWNELVRFASTAASLLAVASKLLRCSVDQYKQEKPIPPQAARLLHLDVSNSRPLSGCIGRAFMG